MMGLVSSSDGSYYFRLGSEVGMSSRPVRSLLAYVLLLAVLLPLAAQALAAPAAQGDWPRPLRVGLIPNQAPDRIRAQYQPFGQYLSRYLDDPVELFVATDYAGVV